MNKLMDGYDVVGIGNTYRIWGKRYRVYRYETNEISGNIHAKVYKFGYPDYKSMLKKHPELK